MFGIYKCPQKPAMTINPRHLCQDRFIRTPFANSSYKYQKFLYQKNKYLGKELQDADQVKENNWQFEIIKNHKHNEREILKRIVRDRIEEKMKEFEKIVDERRSKLNVMLANEERRYITEIIKQTQTFADMQYEEKKQKVIQAKARIEKERLDFVDEMKFIQYTQKCTEIRPLLSQQRVLEAAAAQKIQRVELTQRKNAEAELDQFWDEMQMKQDKAMNDVVEHKALEKLKLQKEYMFFLQCQLDDQKVLEELRRQEKQKEAEELEIIKEKLEQEEKAEKERKYKLKEEIAFTLSEGVRQRDIAIKQQTEDELKIIRAYEKISAEELRKEKEKIRNKTSTALRDMQLFTQYNEDLALQKMELEKQRERLEKERMDDIKRKYDEAKLKDLKARNDLLKSCLTTNEIMIEEKRQEREKQKKKQDEENKFIEFTRQQSNKLNIEAARQKKLAIAKYRSDLDNQVKYAEIIKEREREKEKRILKSAEEEEQKYAKIVADVLGDSSKQSKLHAFKQVMVLQKCPCPKPNY